MTAPAITVLMPVYNAERHLAGALDSILGQSFTDFELLIVNDGSTDRSRDIVAGYDDPRMRVVDTENRGVAASLRLGMELARGAYVARMDADDECLPHRLAVEKAYLDAHPEAILVHGRVTLIGDDGRVLLAAMGDPRTPLGTKWLLAWHNVPFHPTVMLRASSFREHDLNYRPEANLAEDFDLWFRAATAGEIHMLDEVLVRYRIHAGGVTRGERAARQLDVQGYVIRSNFAHYGIALDDAKAREIAIISGSTRLDAGTYRYRALRGHLLPLLADLEAQFAARHAGAPEAWRVEQAMQLALWARHMLGTARMEAALLLWAALRRHPMLALRARCWATLMGCVLPAAWFHQLMAAMRGNGAFGAGHTG